jgi:hypothetical protein
MSTYETCPKCKAVKNPGCLCEGGGYKADHDKPDYSLLPSEWLEEVSKAFTYGAKKYSRHNYLTGMDWHRMFSAALRHGYKFWRGEDIDTETGIHHLGHMGACVGMLYTHVVYNLGTDNRWKGPKK